ncbi:MAG: hypothetical protein KDA89_07750, partial [Planctomycetaceae bacterium]|nr:hypothetical protein [Planctomycetaceae bacterium]
DTVQADGMSEFNVDKASGKLTLALTQKRLGAVTVNITAHQKFDAAAENLVTEIPGVTPLDVEREAGRIILFAPRFLDVSTPDERVSGLFPAESSGPGRIGRAVQVASWKYTQRPFRLAVQTSPRPAQIAAVAATTVGVEPDVTKVSSEIRFQIENAGIDTFRLAVPEAVADDVRFRSLNPQHVIQQRVKSDAVDGWVTWTLILQDEVTGDVRLAADWELRADGNAEAEADAIRSVALSPVRVLPPFADDAADKRKVTLTQTRGEVLLRRHESLSITATGDGDTLEKIDVRELEYLSPDGYLAFRYFSQPVSLTVSVRRHEIHEVVATVVSRAAVEIVTDRQVLAHYRCRLLVTSSERQRLRIDLPAGADLQAPMINSTRTTMEKAVDVTAADGWDAYYLNISREGTSDEAFRITLQFRCPISDGIVYPYEGRGSRQTLRLPLIGDDAGGTVVQETRLAVWSPKDIALVGEPRGWSAEGAPVWSLQTPLVSPSSHQAARELDNWIGDGAGDFAKQGVVAVYRAIGRRETIRPKWWNRPFLVLVISGTLCVVGFILRHTSWENRLTLVIVSCLGTALWSLHDSTETYQYVTAASYGLIAVAALWIGGLLIGTSSAVRPGNLPSGDNRPGSSDKSAGRGAATGKAGAAASAFAAGESSSAMSAGNAVVTGTVRRGDDPLSGPPGTVSPSPEVTRWMDDLMGGKQS